MSETPGSVDPTRAQFDAFKGLPRDTPIQMLNLIRLKPLADYPADHPDHGKGVTGLEAYRAYGRTCAGIFARVGLRQVWAGRPETVVTGPADERWDLAFIAEYPNAGAFQLTNMHFNSFTYTHTNFVFWQDYSASGLSGSFTCDT
jgi:hypothetical protein